MPHEANHFTGWDQTNEDTLFDIAERLPQEAAEALLNIGDGHDPAIRNGRRSMPTCLPIPRRSVGSEF